MEDLVAVLSQRLNLHTGDTVKETAGDAVVVVEQLLPQELISGHSQPLSAGQTSSQHSIMGQTQEDLQHQAVRQNLVTLHPNILCNTNTMGAMLYKRQLNPFTHSFPSCSFSVIKIILFQVLRHLDIQM
uniref:Uncharacterized protein n=1 Tax=Mastacembelus armatus TaxID=205130 RepID=A0A3Q3MA73_9TELE